METVQSYQTIVDSLIIGLHIIRILVYVMF